MEQEGDVAVPPDVPAVTQRKQIPSKKRGQKNPWEEIMEVSVPRGMEDAAEVVQFFAQKLVQDRMVEKMYDMPGP